MVSNSKVLITGGTGSLGRELAKQLLAQGNGLIIYSRNEERQYEMSQELAGREVKFVIGDVRDTEALRRALHGCEIAIHGAAMKDLIMCEAQPTQCVMNNIVGTMSFLAAVRETPTIRRACAVSTDKAASPSNVYGCSKYIMEQLVHEASQGGDTIHCCVRFGNMIDSAGSLIEIWKNQPSQEIKLTHPDVARFFFSLRDAAETVLQSIDKAANGETYIRRMKAARIYNVLRQITGRDEFEIIGLYPGEKIHEELVGENETRFCFAEGDYYIVRPGTANPAPPQLLSTENADYFSDDELADLLRA